MRYSSMCMSCLLQHDFVRYYCTVTHSHN